MIHHPLALLFTLWTLVTPVPEVPQLVNSDLFDSLFLGKAVP